MKILTKAQSKFKPLEKTLLQFWHECMCEKIRHLFSSVTVVARLSIHLGRSCIFSGYLVCFTQQEKKIGDVLIFETRQRRMIHHILDKRPDCGSKEYVIGRKGCRGSYQRVEDIFWECVTVCTAIIWSKTRGLNLIMGKWFLNGPKPFWLFSSFSQHKRRI